MFLSILADGDIIDSRKKLNLYHQNNIIIIGSNIQNEFINSLINAIENNDQILFEKSFEIIDKNRIFDLNEMTALEKIRNTFFGIDNELM